MKVDLDNRSCGKQAGGAIAGRDVAMSLESVVCYNCDKAGQHTRSGPMPAKNYIKQDKSKKDSKTKRPEAKAGSRGSTLFSWLIT